MLAGLVSCVLVAADEEWGGSPIGIFLVAIEKGLKEQERLNIPLGQCQRPVLNDDLPRNEPSDRRFDGARCVAPLDVRDSVWQCWSIGRALNWCDTIAVHESLLRNPIVAGHFFDVLANVCSYSFSVEDYLDFRARIGGNVTASTRNNFAAPRPPYRWCPDGLKKIVVLVIDDLGNETSRMVVRPRRK